MKRLDAPHVPTRPGPFRRRLAAAVAAAGLLAAVGLAWVLVAASPRTLRAAVQDGLDRAASAHLTITIHDGQGRPIRSEVWYRRGEGLRSEAPDRVLVDDGRSQWSWDPGAPEDDRLVLRQPSPAYFVAEIGKLLALDNWPAGWTRDRAPELDAEAGGRRCLGYAVLPPEVDPDIPPGARRADPRPERAVVLAEPEGRVHRVTFQRGEEGGDWKTVREIAIEFDVPVPPERVAARLPEGGRVVDRDRVFEGRYPLERALYRADLGGLTLAVHDVRPLVGREGFFVVSSVRGTPEHLKRFPPRRRRLNSEVSVLEVATQPHSNWMWSGNYDQIILANAAHEGVDFAWWLIVPRKFYRLKDGHKVYEPENDSPATPGEPGRLDDLAGMARVPLLATYGDDQHRDPRGAPRGVSCWAEVPLPADRPPTTLEDVAARTRRDMTVMRHGGTYKMLGVAADAKNLGDDLRPLSHFEPEKVSDAAYAAAVRRGLDDLREFDKLGDIFLGGEPPAIETRPR